MSRLIVARSITAFDRDGWSRCFPDELEDWAYYRAVETAGFADFSWRYLGVLDDAGRIEAVVPAFRVDYRLDTTLQGPLKRLSERITRLFPNLLSLPLFCLGSPVSEACHLGFAPGLDEAAKLRAIRLIATGLEEAAAAEGVAFVAVKDLSGDSDRLWRACGLDFVALPGLPVAVLPLVHRSFDDYVASLGAATRKDLRRKMRAAKGLRIERRRQIGDILPEIMRLYAETRALSRLQFETLPAGYFEQILAFLPDRAVCVCYFAGARLIAFNLLLEDDRRSIDKFFAMDHAAGIEWSPYFISWLENVRAGIACGRMLYQSGQASYATKLRLGAHLVATRQYFRHRRRGIHWLLVLLSRLVRLDRADPQIAALMRGMK